MLRRLQRLQRRCRVAVSLRQPFHCGAARVAPSQAAVGRYDPRRWAAVLPDAGHQRPASPMLIAWVPPDCPNRLNCAAWRKNDLYPTSCIGFVNWLTTQVRLAHDLSLLPARKSPFAGTFLAAADRNDVSSALARERFLDALLCEHQRLPELRLCAVPYRCRAFFAVAALNETPNRIETVRIRSGLRFMIRAASSKDFDALASSITRRSSANDHDLRAIGEALL